MFDKTTFTLWDGAGEKNRKEDLRLKEFLQGGLLGNPIANNKIPVSKTRCGHSQKP